MSTERPTTIWVTTPSAATRLLEPTYDAHNAEIERTLGHPELITIEPFEAGVMLRAVYADRPSKGTARESYKGTQRRLITPSDLAQMAADLATQGPSSW